jgi:hypothetical protein
MIGERDPLIEERAKRDSYSLGALLVSQGYVTDADIDAALNTAAAIGSKLGEALVANEAIDRKTGRPIEQHTIDLVAIDQIQHRATTPAAKAEAVIQMAQHACARHDGSIAELDKLTRKAGT